MRHAVKQFIIVLCLTIASPSTFSSEPKISVVVDDSGGRKLLWPFGVGLDGAGNLYVVQMKGHQIGRLDTQGSWTAIAGTGEKGYDGDGGPAAQAKLNTPHHLLVMPNGDIFVADTENFRVRKIDGKSGIISTIAGSGKKGFGGDGGPAIEAQFGAIYCLAMTANGERLYLDDLDNKRIRAVDMKTGIVTTVAGNGKKGVPAGGSDAASSPLFDPRAITVDSKGNLYILERGGNALRVVGGDGKIRTVAGTGKVGNSGDGGPALEATLNDPKHLCADSDDNVLIADTENHVIRKYFPRDGTIVRVAGTGKAGSAGAGGPPQSCQLSRPHGVLVDRNGAIYISDSNNNRVLKVE